MTYTCTVMHETRLRNLPQVAGSVSYELLPVGAIFKAIAVKAATPGMEEWLQREDGKWTAAIYPNSAVPPQPKIFVNYIEDVPQPPFAEKFGVVMANYQWFGKSRPTMNKAPVICTGLPDTCKLFNSAWVPLTSDLQNFWFGQLALSAPNLTVPQLKSAWASLIKGDRAFTNKHGPNNGYADFINGVNTNCDPVMLEPILTGGAIVKIVGGPILKMGEQHWEIETIDAHQPIDPFTAFNFKTHPYLFFRATSSVRSGWNARKRIWANECIEEQFWQLGGADVWVPMFTLGKNNLIPCNRVKVLQPGNPFPSPYHR